MTEFTRADGHQAASAEPAAQKGHFRDQFPPRAELVLTIGRSHREEDGTLVIDEITEMHWSAWC